MRHEIGLISDTHGLLRESALNELRGVERIIHAGDIGPEDILERLSAIAPLHVVRGNNDRDAWALELPEAIVVRVGGLEIGVTHDRKVAHQFSLLNGCSVLVAGHSHKPMIEEGSGVLFVNPGSAGPRRFSLPITVGRLIVDGNKVEARIVELSP